MWEWRGEKVVSCLRDHLDSCILMSFGKSPTTGGVYSVLASPLWVRIQSVSLVFPRGGVLISVCLSLIPP